MALSVGDLAINITTSIASFVSGIQEATNRLNRFASDSANVANQAKAQFDKIGNVFKTIATLSIAGFGVHAFTSLVEGAIDAEAHLQDLAEKVGTTASKMSALIPAARLSGASLDDVGLASTKFSKNLVEIQTGEGKAAEAFKRLGFNAADAARFLKDPVEGLHELSQASNKYVDDGNKAAIMQLLLGKGASGLANFMKELGQQTELVTRVTDEQAAAAKRLQDQYALIKLGGEEMRQNIANAVIPALSQMALQFLAAKEGGAGFFQASAIATVGQDTVVERITDLGKKVTETKKAIDNASQPVANELFGANDQTEALKILNATLDESVKKLKIYQQIRDQTIFNNLAGQDIGDASDRLAGNSAARRPSSKGSLDTTGLADASTKVDEFAKAMQNARQMTAEADAALAALTEGTGKQTQADQALLKVRASDVWKTWSKTQQDALTKVLEGASATQKAIDVDTRFNAVVEKISEAASGFATSFAADFQALTDKFNQGTLALEAYRDLTQKLLDQQPFAKKQTEAIREEAEALQRLNDLMRDAGLNNVQSLVDLTRSFSEQNDEIQFQTSLIGQTAEAQERLTAIHRIDLDVKRQIQALDQNDPELANITAKIQAAGDLAKANVAASIGARQQIEQGLENTKTVFGELDSVARDVWNSIGGKAGNMWEKIKADGKRILLDWLYSLALKPFLISIAASVTGVSGSAAANVLNPGAATGGFDITKLFSGGNPFANAAGPAAGLYGTFATSATGQFLGLSEALAGPATAAGELSVGLTGLGSAIGTAIPYIGLAIAAFTIIKGILDRPHGPKTQGAGGATFDDRGTYTGTLPNAPDVVGITGDNQQQTEAAAIGKTIGTTFFDTLRLLGGKSGGLQFGAGFSTDPQGTAPSFVHTAVSNAAGAVVFQQSNDNVGRDDASLQAEIQLQTQRALLAALQQSDLPAGIAKLINSVDVSSATIDQVTAVEALAASYAGLNETLQDNLTAAFDGTQATADKLVAFAGVAKNFGSSIAGLGPILEGLDPSKITEFVDALGGAQSFATQLAAFNTNFGTSAEAAANATTRLTTVFGNLGIAVPQTHAEFVQVVEDMIAMGNTDAVAALLGVSNAFVTLHGTAEALRQELEKATQAGQDYYSQHFLTPQEQTLQRQTIDSTILYDATKQGTLLNSVLSDFGLNTVPTTVEGVRRLVSATAAKYGVESEEYKALLRIIPTIGDLIDSVNGFGAAAVKAASDIDIAVSQIHGQIQNFGTSLSNLGKLAEGATDFATQLQTAVLLYGDQIATLKAKIADANTGPYDPFKVSQAAYVYTPELQQTTKAFNIAKERLERFEKLTEQYGEAIAAQLVPLQEWYRQQKQLYAGNATALAIVETQMGDKWHAIIAGAAGATDAVATTIEEFIKKIQGIADATGGNTGQQAKIEQALSTAKLAGLQTRYAAALPGSALATAIAADIAKLQAYNAGLSTQIAHFADYSKQYGDATANQLVELENQFETWKASVAGMEGSAEAIAIITDIFNAKFQDIVDGVGDGVDKLKTVQQSIADFLRGLSISDLSPLTPKQKLDQSQAAYVEELIKAQSGDLTAMGDITQFAEAYLKQARDFYASAPQFTDIYNAITEQLAALAGTTPTGLPLAPESDAAQITAGLQGAATDIAAATQSSAVAIVDAVDAAAGTIVAAVTNVQPTAQPQAVAAPSVTTTSISNTGPTFATSTVDNSSTDLSRTVQSNTSNVDNSVSDLSRAISESVTTIDNSVADLSRSTSVATTAIDNSATDLSRSVGDTVTTIDNSVRDLSRSVAEGATTIDNSARDLSQAISESVTSIDNSIADLSHVTTDNSTSIDNSAGNVSRVIETSYATTADNSISDLSQTSDQRVTNIDNSIADLKTATSVATTTIDNSVRDLSRSVAEGATTIDNSATDLSRATTVATSATSNSVTNLSRTLNESLTSTTVNSSSDDLSRTVNESATSTAIDNSVNDLSRAIDDSATTVDNSTSTLSRVIATSTSSSIVDNSVSDVSRTADERVTNVDNSVADLRSATSIASTTIDQSVRSLSNTISEGATTIDNSVADLSRVTSVATTAIDNSITDLSRAISDSVTTIDSSTRDLSSATNVTSTATDLSTHDLSRTTATTQTTTNVDSSTADLSRTISDSVTTIDQSVADLSNTTNAASTTIDNSAADLSQRFANTTNDLSTAVSSVTNDLSTKVNSNVVNNVDQSVANVSNTDLAPLAASTFAATQATLAGLSASATNAALALAAIADKGGLDPLPSADPVTPFGSAQDAVAKALEAALPDGATVSQADVQELAQATRDNGEILAAMFEQHASTNVLTEEQNVTLQRILAAYGRTAVTAK